MSDTSTCIRSVIGPPLRAHSCPSRIRFNLRATDPTLGSSVSIGGQWPDIRVTLRSLGHRWCFQFRISSTRAGFLLSTVVGHVPGMVSMQWDWSAVVFCCLDACPVFLHVSCDSCLSLHPRPVKKKPEPTDYRQMKPVQKRKLL